jgi:hypothetical protein
MGGRMTCEKCFYWEDNMCQKRGSGSMNPETFTCEMFERRRE